MYEEKYKANDDYDRYRHTGEHAEWFEDEPEDDEDAPYICQCLKGAVPSQQL